MSGQPTTQILAFDIYGTLLDTNTITDALIEHANLESSKATEISTLWRRYQLEYTWRMNSMNIYESWDVVTKKSLLHAATEFQLELEDDVVVKLMKSYESLRSFPDSKEALEELGGLNSIKTLVFSNGTQHMVEEALRAGTIRSMIEQVYVADAVQKYKPSPEIYRGLIKAVGKEASPQEVWLVSGNPFDVTGARNVGMNAIWVDRAKKGWADRLAREPTEIVHDLREIGTLMKRVLASE